MMASASTRFSALSWSSASARRFDATSTSAPMRAIEVQRPFESSSRTGTSPTSWIANKRPGPNSVNRGRRLVAGWSRSAIVGSTASANCWCATRNSNAAFSRSTILLRPSSPTAKCPWRSTLFTDKLLVSFGKFVTPAPASNIPGQAPAGAQFDIHGTWIPAFAGMTTKSSLREDDGYLLRLGEWPPAHAQQIRNERDRGKNQRDGRCAPQATRTERRDELRRVESDPESADEANAP